MRGINLNLSLGEHLMKIPRYVGYLVRSFFVFKEPLSIILHYLGIKKYRFSSIDLRNGARICLSGNADVTTVFVVYVKRDYGKMVDKPIVIDIGANIGVFSLYAAGCGAAKIYAFEPNSKAYDVLLRNIAANGFEDVIIPFNVAVTGCDGETVKIPSESSPYNYIRKEDSGDNCEEVSSITLATIMTKNGLDFVDLVKIDCEGAEYEIVPGMADWVFSRVGEIRMEFHKGPLDDLISVFRKHGFVSTRFERDSAIIWFAKKV